MLFYSIPGFGDFEIQHIVTDYTGTLSENGVLVPGVADLLTELSKKIDKIFVMTSDTTNTAKAQLKGLPVELEILTGECHHLQKSEKVESLGWNKVISIGNGRNDRSMLEKAIVGIGIELAEGLAKEARDTSNVTFHSITDALISIRDRKAIIASLGSY